MCSTYNYLIPQRGTITKTFSTNPSPTNYTANIQLG